jgi:hypothetical protein
MAGNRNGFRPVNGIMRSVTASTDPSLPDASPRLTEDWIHLRTTVESTFATVRLRTRVTKVGCMDGLSHAGWAGR